MTWLHTLEYFIDHLPQIIAAVFAGLVYLRQSSNKTVFIETQRNLEGLRHDVRNGLGVAIAEKAVEHITPVLEKTATAITETVAQNAADVAAALEKKTWDGVERRIGPADRRGQ